MTFDVGRGAFVWQKPRIKFITTQVANANLLMAGNSLRIHPSKRRKSNVKVLELRVIPTNCALALLKRELLNLKIFMRGLHQGRFSK